MGYFERLLTQRDPLERHELAELEEWLNTLRGDVEVFGNTPQDQARMGQIEARIKQERSRP